ncbi:MAG: hypothetical protein PHU03_06370 [Syntrophales bacterium]|nr:hypothetical protein [Syntrophales bacterium]
MKIKLPPLESLVPYWGPLVDMAEEMMRSVSGVSGSRSEAIISDKDACGRLYAEAAEKVESLFADSGRKIPARPALVLENRLKTLPFQAALLYAALLPIALLLMLLTVSAAYGSAAIWIVRILIVSLLFTPILHYRSRKAQIMGDFRYQRDGGGTSFIKIDMSFPSRMRSNLVEACARHLFFEFFGSEFPFWAREGWVRLAQFSVLEKYSTGNTGHKARGVVLEKIADELRLALTFVSAAVGIRPPSHFRRVRSAYSSTSLENFLTGKPLVDMTELFDRCFGTACFFLAAKSMGPQYVLECPERVVETFTPTDR